MKKEYYGKGILPRIVYEEKTRNITFYDKQTGNKVAVPKRLLKKIKHLS